MLDEMGIDTGLKTHDVIDMALEIEKVCGRELHGHVTRSGHVRHKSKETLAIKHLRPGMEIPPALFFFSPAKDLPQTVIREALNKNWAISEGLAIDTDGVNVHGELKERDILITQFEVIELKAENNQAELRVSSRKNTGDVYLDGNVKIAFE